MNTPMNVQKNKIRSPKRLFNFRFAAVLASLCLSVGLLLPAIKNLAGNHHPLPAGQLKADARTMVAAVRYLFEADPVIQKNPAPLASRPATVAQRMTGNLVEIPGNLSTQVEMHAASSTNPPAQT